MDTTPIRGAHHTTGPSAVRRRSLRLRPALAIAALIAVAPLALVRPAAAVTNSQPDGSGHPYAGMFVGDFSPSHTGLEPGCSGTLVSPTVFLTAAHCIVNRPERLAAQLYVTFDSGWPFPGAPTDLHAVASYHADPDFLTPDFPAWHDLAVFVLAEPVAGITPARLPTAGLLDQLAAKGGLIGATFDVVGYGIQGFEVGGGPPQPIGDPLATGLVERRVATSRFQALTPDVLNLFMQDVLGYGGTCLGDSGGPHLLGGTNLLVGTSSWIDAGGCQAYSANVRLDTPPARAFLGQYVTLP